MNDDYLWNRSGPPDPEIESMERALEPLRFQPGPWREPARPQPWRWALAAAAVTLVAAWLLRSTAVIPATTAWQVTGVDGTARLGMADARLAMAVRSGQVVRTGGASQLTLEAEPVGRIDLGPDSELRAATDRTMRLGRGKLHAFIWAPPRQFSVETPSARALDLGCEYTLNVDASGDGLLEVSTGWVAFLHGGHEAFIPAGAECATRRRTGPGIPVYADAPPAVRDALAAFESGDQAALGSLLAGARPRDGLTLWHLLTRVNAAARGAVFDRLAELVALPPGATREAALRGDPHVLDLCWDALRLEDTGWWRGWERPWR